ncbi:MAG: hypothetical protein M1823_004760 [Watsoniomyces obsoletus]|nr:MAG: hypothetical protein M1823_004760 [Watsoniomyces obsoletus]
MSVFVFCTSRQVTPELVRDLDEHCGKVSNWPNINFFSPARHDPQHVQKGIKEPSETSPDYTVDHFEGTSDAQLRQLFLERFIASGLFPQFDDGYFAVLDERSVRDRTVVFHLHHLADPMDEDCHHYVWSSWRVRFEDAYFLAEGLMSLAVTDEVYVEHGHRFVDEDGILHPRMALNGVSGLRVREDGERICAICSASRGNS